MREVPPLSQTMERIMVTPFNAREPVSLGQCFCNANLCGRYSTKGYVLTACAFRAILEKAEGTLYAEGTEENKVLWSWRVW